MHKLALVLCLACVGCGERLRSGPLAGSEAALEASHPSSSTGAEGALATLLLALEPAAAFTIPHAGGRGVSGAQRHPGRISATSMRDSWSRREMLHATAAALLASTAGVRSAWAKEKIPETKEQCVSYCDEACVGTAGKQNQAYCTGMCGSFCEDFGTPAFEAKTKKGGGEYDEQKAAQTTKMVSNECSQYKTEKAKAYCERKITEANSYTSPDDLPRSDDNPLVMVLGKSVDGLFATLFGATQQASDINKADVGKFASEVSKYATEIVKGD